MKKLILLALFLASPFAHAQVSEQTIRDEASRHALNPCLETLSAETEPERMESLRSIRTREMQNLIDDVMASMRVLSASVRMEIYREYRRACIEGRLNED